MEFLSSAALVIFLLALLVYLWKNGSDRSDRKCLPSPSYWVISRWAHLLKVCPQRFLVLIGEQFGGFYAFRFFSLRDTFIVINDWKTMKEAFVTNSVAFSGRPSLYVAKRMLQHKDLLFVDGPLWTKKRNFTLHHLRNLGFGKTSMGLLTEITKFVESLELRNCEEPVCVKSLFFSPVINVLWGLLADGYNEEMGDTINTVFQLFHECINLNFMPKLRFVNFQMSAKLKRLLELTNIVKDFLGKEIDVNRRNLLANTDPCCFFDIFLAEMAKAEATSSPTDQNIYTMDHLIGISFDFLQAGIETTVSTLEWTMLYMALWPEIQTMVQDELDRVIGRHRQPTFADHSNLPFMEATILEIHRFSSVIPMSGPHCTTCAVQLNGYDIGSRTIVLQNIWAVHNDKHLWGDPEVFRPQRFINELGKIEKPEYLIPFSLGPRKCLGESFARIELFLFMACMLQKFSISLITGLPPPTLDTVPSVTRSPQKFSLLIRPRSPVFPQI